MSPTSTNIEALDKTLTNLQTLCTTLKPRIENLSTLPTGSGKGLSLLDIKTQCLLLYLRNLFQVIKLKLKGKSLVDDDDDNETVWKLIEIRTVLEKVRGVEGGLRYQIERLLLLGNEEVGVDGGKEEGEEEREVVLRPNVAAMVGNGNDEEEGVGGEGDGLYRAPRIAAVGMEEVGRRKEEREEKRMRGRIRRSGLVREMLEEVSGRPDEWFDDGLGGGDVEAARIVRREERERRMVEEETFRRVGLSKKDKKRRKELEMRARGFEGVEKGGGDLLGVVELAERIGGKGKERGEDGDKGKIEKARKSMMDDDDEEFGMGRKRKRGGSGGRGRGGKRRKGGRGRSK